MNWRHILSEVLGNRLGLGQLLHRCPGVASGALTRIPARREAEEPQQGGARLHLSSTNWHNEKVSVCAPGTWADALSHDVPTPKQEHGNSTAHSERAPLGSRCLQQQQTARANLAKSLKEMETYPGSKTPGVRQAGPEQDCSIISR